MCIIPTHITRYLSMEMGRSCPCFGNQFKTTTNIIDHLQDKKTTRSLKLKWEIK